MKHYLESFDYSNALFRSLDSPSTRYSRRMRNSYKHWKIFLELNNVHCSGQWKAYNKLLINYRWRFITPNMKNSFMYLKQILISVLWIFERASVNFSVIGLPCNPIRISCEIFSEWTCSERNKISDTSIFNRTRCNVLYYSVGTIDRRSMFSNPRIAMNQFLCRYFAFILSELLDMRRNPLIKIHYWKKSLRFVFDTIDNFQILW